jgi:uncharacterized DUF497 family protein
MQQRFRDPLSLSILDAEHSEPEERWITMGKDSHGLPVLIHVLKLHRRVQGFDHLARKANKKEVSTRK